MKALFADIQSAIAPRVWRWLATAFAFLALYYAALLLSLIVRFGEWPNYVTFYNWPSNVLRIFASTPSWSDALEISAAEWLLEVGYMNYDFGHGISEWSMTLLPLSMAVIFLLGLLISSIWAVVSASAVSCPHHIRRAPAALGSGFAALLIGFTNITATWVVCCASPSWIVGLSMLGLSASAANWIEPIGPWLSIAGFATLIAILLLLSLRRLRSGDDIESGRFEHSKLSVPEGA